MQRPAVLLIAIACATTVSAQHFSEVEDPFQWQQWKPLDQTVEDVSELATSLRQIDTDLYAPSGFSRAYEVPGADNRIMRVDGGLYAVFPRSRYVPSIVGPLPEIPDDTMFYIGGLPAVATPGSWQRGASAMPGEMMMQDYSEHRGATRINSRITIGEPEPVALPRPRLVPPSAKGRQSDSQSDMPARTIATDPVYRWQRVRDLVKASVQDADGPQAARGRSSSSSSK